MYRTDRVLAIFARYPRRGTVKTRLAESIGEGKALNLYEAMLEDTLHRFAGLDCEKHVYFTGCTSFEGRSFVDRLGLDDSYESALQGGNSLGERMWNVTHDLLNRFGKVVIVGTDAPTIPLEYVTEAFEVLDRVSVVFGPARDGGYYLVGSSEARREIFEEIPWGTGEVLSETLQRLEAVSFHLLPVWYDVDTGHDLDRLSKELSQQSEVVAPALRRFFRLLSAVKGTEEEGRVK